MVQNEAAYGLENIAANPKAELYSVHNLKSHHDDTYNCVIHMFTVDHRLGSF